MILVDSSVWIDHLRAGDTRLAALLEGGRVLTHPFIVGELALGSLRQRGIVLGALSGLPSAAVANDLEVLKFIETHALSGSGIGYIDAHLLAAVRLTGESRLWTKDRKLRMVGDRLGLTIAFDQGGQ